MAVKLKHLPNTELEIMLILWDAGQPVSRSYIDEHLNQKSWSKTMILMLLSRLVDKGYVKSESTGKGKMNLFSALVTQDEYLTFEGQSVFGRLCGRSLKCLVTALYDNDTIDQAEIEELQEFFEELKHKGNQENDA